MLGAMLDVKKEWPLFGLDRFLETILPIKALSFSACFFKYPDHCFFQASSSIVFALWAQQQGDGVSKGHDFRAVTLVKLYASHDSDIQSSTRYNHRLVPVQPKSYFELQRKCCLWDGLTTFFGSNCVILWQ